MLRFCLLILVIMKSGACLKISSPEASKKHAEVPLKFPDSEEDIGLRVVGGKDAEGREIPFIVSIQKKDGNSWYHTCGGSLISSKAVLTAGHCLSESAGKLTPPASLRIVAGVNDIRQADRGKILTVREVIAHPDFVGSLEKAETSELVNLASGSSGMEKSFFAPLYGGDLGLIILSQKVNLSEGTIAKVAPDLQQDSLLSPERVLHLQGPVFRLAGWGITERRPIDELLSNASQFDHQKTSPVLKTGPQPVLPGDACRSHLLNWFKKKLGFAYAWLSGNVSKTLDQTMAHIVCAGEMRPGSTSFCSGDSGGPLFYKIPDSGPRIGGRLVQDKKPASVQVGIVSFSLGCNSEGIPDLYTKVGDFSDWIETTLKEKGAGP